MISDDRRWMEQVLAIASLGEGTARPNPRVGCVVVADGQAVGWGWHKAPGGAHAEIAALERAGDAARGSTMYVNLEPCAHHGRTPPCVDRVIASGVRRVVASIQDPNPLVDGRGFRALRDAGIRVDVGVLDAAARRLNADFLHWHAHGRPRVTLKSAASLDGRTAARGGVSRWITGAVARAFAHRLRMRYDAILVGADTVRADDPALDVRLPGVVARPAARVVLAASGRLPTASRVFRDDGAIVLVYVAEGAKAAAAARLPATVTVVEVPTTATDTIDVDAVLRDLGGRGMQSVLIEGGARTAGLFLRAGRIDALALFRAPALLGDRGGRPVIDDDAVEAPELASRLRVEGRLALGEDDVVFGRLMAAKEARCSRG